MREGYSRGYGDRGEERGRGRGVWQRHGGFGGRGDRGGREYGFGCDKDGSGVILESHAVNALHPAHLAHLAQQNSVFVCAQQQGSLGSMKPHDGAYCQRGLGRGNGRGFGRGQGFGREGREGHEGHGHGCEGHEGRGWGHGRLGRDGQGCGSEGHEGRGRAGRAGRGNGYGHGREQSNAHNDSSKPLQILSVKLPRVELGQTSTTATSAVNATKSSIPACSKERHTVADVVAAGLCTSCSDCVALCGRRQAISMQTNDAGDLVPVVDMSLCNLCGKCYRKCPAILETQSSQH